MTDIRELIPQEEKEHRQIYGHWFGHFARDVLSLDDFAHVIIPDIDPHSLWGPCYWQARGAVPLPKKNDIALVTFDNRRVTWVVAWWPV